MLVKGVPIGMLTWFGTFEHVYIFYLEPQTYDENQIQILIVKYIWTKVKIGVTNPNYVYPVQMKYIIKHISIDMQKHVCWILLKCMFNLSIAILVDVETSVMWQIFWLTFWLYDHFGLNGILY